MRNVQQEQTPEPTLQCSKVKTKSLQEKQVPKPIYATKTKKRKLFEKTSTPVSTSKELSHTYYLNQIFLVFYRTKTPNYPWRPSVSWLFLSPSPFPCDRGSCSRFNLNVVPICTSRLGTTVMSKRSTLQPLNPDRASDRPIGMNPYRVSKWPMRTGPVAWVSGV